MILLERGVVPMIRNNLSVLLAERGLKMADVVRDTGISKTTIRALYFNMSQGIQFNTLDTLCDYLQVTPGDLIKYHPLKFNLKKKDEDSESLYFDIELAVKRNKVIRGEVDARYEVTEWLSHNQSKVPSGMKVSIYYSPKVREELKKIPTLFALEVEGAVIEEILNKFENLKDMPHIEIYTDVIDYREADEQ